MNQRQAAAEALARTDSRVQQVQNWCGAEVAKLAADLEIARQETKKRVANATSRRAATIAESQGQVLAQIAGVRADIERQNARAPQVRRQLDADVVEPAQAALRAAEEAARGEAAKIIERGRADAESLAQLLIAYTEGGAAARDVLVLQKLLPLLGQITGSGHPLDVARMTVLPSGAAGSVSDLARQAIGANEQLKAVTGVDLHNSRAALRPGSMLEAAPVRTSALALPRRWPSPHRPSRGPRSKPRITDYVSHTEGPNAQTKQNSIARIVCWAGEPASDRL